MPGPSPPELTGLAALRLGWQFARDPVAAMRTAYETHGPLVVVGRVLPFINHPSALLLGVPLILTAGAAFNVEVLNSSVWRSVSLLPGGPRNSAARRMNDNLTRMTGPRAAHYRRLINPSLRKPNVDAMGAMMTELTAEDIAAWPVDETIDLGAYIYRLLRLITVELLFGGDKVLGYPISDMSVEMMERKWSANVMSLPINLPITPYGQSLRVADELERAVIEWVERKRGRLNPQDLVSILINSPGPDGNPADSATVARTIPALVMMTSEACQITLTWALILMDQHPQVAQALLAELDDLSLSLDAVTALPYLDAVVKETMRILPPAPLQMRVAEEDTTLAGHAVPRRARIVLSAFMTNRVPDLYPEASRFLPERWSTINPTPFEYLAFSAGPRRCPGFQFGWNVMKIALAMIFKRYRVALAPGARIDYEVRPTLRPAGHVPATLHPQDGAFASAPIHGTLGDLVELAN